jgi:hypothetical protein
MALILQAGPNIPPEPRYGVAPLEVPPVENLSFSYFLVALVLLGVASLLLYQAAVFQRWATAEVEDAPNPNSGLPGAWVLSALILFAWHFQWLFSSATYFSSESVSEQFVSTIFNPPQELVVALLLASVPPGLLALVKFSFAGSLGRRSAPETKKAPLAALVAATFALIQLTASIITILRFL